MSPFLPCLQCPYCSMPIRVLLFNYSHPWGCHLPVNTPCEALLEGSGCEHSAQHAVRIRVCDHLHYKEQGLMKELKVETRARNTAVTGQNSLETNCSKRAQPAMLLSALQERSEQEYLFFFFFFPLLIHLNRSAQSPL